LKESKLNKVLKQIEIAIRRGFISSLQFGSRFRKDSQSPSLPLQLPEDPTILFLRQDRLGDAIVSTPVFVELYKKYPSAHFIVLLGENNQGIADLLPIDCEIVVYRKKPFADMNMLRKLRKRNIDVLIDLMDNPSSTSSILTALISARYSIGIQKENSFSYNIIVPLVDRAKLHISRRIAELLRPFGIDPELVSLRAVLKSIPAKKIEGRIGLVISAGVIDRQLLPATNAVIASQIIEKEYVNEVLLFCHPKDRKTAESILNQVNNPFVTLAPLTKSFAEYAGQLQTCEIVITPDTSAVHLCSAYEIPVIVVTNPFPPTLHYWTPIGVAYELIAQAPSVASVNAATVITAFDKLVKKNKLQLHKVILAQ
jgi:ADP-heptose:LPS heptosyltransferase